MEIGVWFGKSACYMAEALKDSGKSVQFFAVDAWQPFEREPYMIGLLKEMNVADLYAAFLENLEQAGVSEYVIPIRLESTRAARVFRDNSVAVAFIDADHGYEMISKDIDAWLPKIRTGGIIAGHDYSHGGVWQAVNERFGDRVKNIGSCWSVIK